MRPVKGTRIFNGRAYRLMGKTPSFDSSGKPVDILMQRKLAEDAAEHIRKRNYNARVINWAGGSGIFVAPRRYNRMGRKAKDFLRLSTGQAGRGEQLTFIPDDATVHYIHPTSSEEIEQAMRSGIDPNDRITPSDARNLMVDADKTGTYAATVVDPGKVSAELGVLGIVNPQHAAEPIMTQDGNAFITEPIPADQIVRFTPKDLLSEGERKYRVWSPVGWGLETPASPGLHSGNMDDGPFPSIHMHPDRPGERRELLFESSSLSEAQNYISAMVTQVKKKGYHYTKDRTRIPAYEFKLEIEEVVS